MPYFEFPSMLTEVQRQELIALNTYGGLTNGAKPCTYPLAEEDGVLWTLRYQHSDMRVDRVLGAYVAIPEPGQEEIPEEGRTSKWALIAEWREQEEGEPAVITNQPCRIHLFRGWPGLEEDAQILGFLDSKEVETPVEGSDEILKTNKWSLSTEPEAFAAAVPYGWSRDASALVIGDKQITVKIPRVGNTGIKSDLELQETTFHLVAQGVMNFSVSLLGLCTSNPTDAFYVEPVFVSPTHPQV